MDDPDTNSQKERLPDGKWGLLPENIFHLVPISIKQTKSMSFNFLS